MRSQDKAFRNVGVAYLFSFLSLVAVVVLLHGCSSSSTPSATTGSIKGTIRVDTGGVVSGALVVTKPATASVTTDAMGVYTIVDVVPGIYTVVASKSGLFSDSVSISVAASKTVQTDIVLRSAPLNAAPRQPSLPSPANNSLLSFSDTLTVSWACSDPEGDSIQYDVLWGLTPILLPSQIMASNIKVPHFRVSGNKQGTTYYWQIVAKDTHNNQTVGPVWKLTLDTLDYSLNMNTLGSYGMIPDQPSLSLSSGDFTIETWVNFTSLYGTWQVILAKDDTDAKTDYALMANNTGVFRFQSRNLSNYILGKTKIVEKTWYHVAVVQDTKANKVSMYINGTLDASVPLTGTAVSTTTPLYIGTRINSASGGTPAAGIFGQIDELRICNSVRTDTAIKSTQYTRLSGNESGLVGYWNFNEGPGTQAADKSGHEHVAQLLGMPTWPISTFPRK